MSKKITDNTDNITNNNTGNNADRTDSINKCGNKNIADTQKIAYHISIVTIIANLSLAVFKFLAGVIASSASMVSDAVHSASDVFSTFIVMIGIHIAGKDSDDEHPYGHERYECVASIILADVLAITGFGIGYSAVRTITSGDYSELKIPGTLALIAAIVSIVVKEAMFWYTRNGAKKINSGALMADAWHHRSDAMSSVGALIGIAGSRMGYPILDSVASLVICLFIFAASFDIFKDAINKLVDSSCDMETQKAIVKEILCVPGVITLDSIKSRQFGNKIYVDIEIAADAEMKLKDAHAIAEQVHNRIEEKFPQVKHIMVHVNPFVKGA